jgi:hypothetical protein
MTGRSYDEILAENERLREVLTTSLRVENVCRECDEPAALAVAASEGAPPPTADDPGFCPRDHGCSLPAGHDGDCSLTAALCFCPECEKRADERDTQR